MVGDAGGLGVDMTTAMPRRLGRMLLCVTFALAVGTGIAPAARAGSPRASVLVNCTVAASYGDEVDCLVASIDANGDYSTPGTFTFDPTHVLPATWSATSCAVDADSCEVSAVLATPPGAATQTFNYSVDFTGADGSTVSTPVSVDVSLRTTATTLTCDQADQPLGGSTHCLISVVDQSSDGDTSPAQLPVHVAGMTATSSEPGDVISYDNGTDNASTCSAAVVDGALECGFTLRLDQTHGLRTVTADYAGDPAADELASDSSLAVADGPRVAPAVALSCPAGVPAAAPQTTCSVTVSAADPSGPVPTGSVELDQAYGQPLPFDSGADCTLVDGTCSIAYEVFEGSPTMPAPPVRALYSGDGNYLPGSDSHDVAIIATPSSSSLVCDQPTAAASSSLHCQLSISTAGGTPAPVSPLDSVTVSTTSGLVVCDHSAPVGCGHVNSATATVVGFTLHLGQAGGAQQVTGTYTGDSDDEVAGSTASFAFTTVTAPVVGDGPPGVVVIKSGTTTSVSCGPTVTYRHTTSCVVTVKAPHAVPSGAVRLAPVPGGRPAFTAGSCTLNGKGQCSIAVTVSASPSTMVALTATYAGSAGFEGSAVLAKLAVRPVATSVAVHCTRTTIAVGAVAHCVASVRTEFGQPAATPLVHRSVVTITAHGDRISYVGGRSCHWKVSGHALTCAFTVKAGAAAGTRTIHAYYSGEHLSQDSAAKGATTLKVTARN